VRTRKLTPCEVASIIRAIPERADCPPARCRTMPHFVTVRWHHDGTGRTVAVAHDATGTFVETREAGAVALVHPMAPGTLIPFVRRAIAWMLDGGDWGPP
jgi:hypothetical protein